MKAATPIRPTRPRKVKTTQPSEEQKPKKPEEKKMTQPTNGLPKVVKPPVKRPDIFELQKPFATSCDTFADVVKAFSNGTEDVRQLLNFECELIYECKACRSLFRSLANFIQHKKSHCLDRVLDLKKNLNGEIVDNMIRLSGNNHKGQVIASRKTMRKDIYELLRKVGDLTEEPLPEKFFTRDFQETDAALLSFFQQEGKAATEERSAAVDVDGRIVDPSRSAGLTKQVSTRVNEGNQQKQSNGGERCPKCNSTFASRYEFNLHVSSKICSKPRYIYICPLCQKVVSTSCMYSVHRHLRKVHKKSSEQVRKLQKRIVKKLAKGYDHSRSQSSSSARGVSCDKLQNGVVGSTSRSAASQFSAPLAVSPYKRNQSLENGTHSPNKTVFEVRTYGKTPLPDISASLLAKQPFVILTKTSFPPTMKTITITNSSPASASTGTAPVSPSCKLPQPPAKKPKVENDLSWLKKGPSVPIVEGPLTRTARALYGSPKKNIACGSGAVGVSSKDKESSSPSGQDDSMDSDNGERLSDPLPSDLEENDSDFQDCEPSNKRSSAMNMRLSSDDNVRSLTSSVNSFDSSPSKAENAKVDLNDRMSTSGVETDMSPANASDDENSDVDRLVNEYSKDLSSSPQHNSSHRPSSDASSKNSPPDILIADGHAPRSQASEKSDARKDSVPSADQTATSNHKNEHPTSNKPRESDEVGGSCYSVAKSTSTSEGVNDGDSDDSNDCTNDDNLRSNMMEMIFGSLPSTMFKGFSTVGDKELSS